MKKRVAINGFGRIGRLTFRNLLQNDNIEIVAINDLTDNAKLAYLLKYDSAHGLFDGTVDHDEDHLFVNGVKINAYAEKDPTKLPWKALKVDIVLECTGIFRSSKKAGWHIKAGAKKVLLSAPAKSDDIQTIVLGVNDDKLDPKSKIVSNASCTTNCLAPMMKVILDNWGIKYGTMTTTHAYTGDQAIQDSPHKDNRRGRAAAFNMVPTSTGAAKAVGIVLPEVKDKLFAMAVRVPVITGSLVELNILVKNRATVKEINAAFKRASENELKGILQYSEDDLVSSDIVRNPHSCIFDAQLTGVKEDMVKFIGWYDNEAGYSARLAELTARL